MATPQCMSNDGNPAIFIGTFLTEGDSVALCNDCMPAFCSAVVSRMLGIDPELFSVAVAAMERDAAGEPGDPAEVAAPPAMVEVPSVFVPSGDDGAGGDTGVNDTAATGSGEDPPDNPVDEGAVVDE